MPSLHQVMSADTRCWKDCAGFCRPGDSVVLVDAGAGLLADPDFIAGFAPPGSAGRLFALEADAGARGLLALADRAGLTLLSDRQWVQVVCGHEKILSWR